MDQIDEFAASLLIARRAARELSSYMFLSALVGTLWWQALSLPNLFG